MSKISTAWKGYEMPKWRQNLSSPLDGKPVAKTVLVIVMLVAVLGIGILAAVIASKMGDEYEEGEECDCPTEVEKGWKWFSIAAIALGIPMLVIFFIFFGCKRSM